MSGELVEAMAAEEARTLTNEIKSVVDAVWDLVAEAYQGRAWAALGYSSWDEYCAEEFDAGRLRLPREKRHGVVTSLRDAGLSVRAIAAATGDGVGSVHRALQPPVPSGTPEPEPTPASSAEPSSPPKVTGIDGKSYPVRPVPLREAKASARTAQPSAEAKAREAFHRENPDLAYRVAVSKELQRLYTHTLNLDPQRCAEVMADDLESLEGDMRRLIEWANAVLTAQRSLRGLRRVK